jgi:hypothetical protein
MRKILTLALALGSALAIDSAVAAENWTTRLPGVTEGLAAGAVPPEGLYFVNETFISPTRVFDSKGNSTSTHVDAFVDVPILEWAPGIKILGADYAAFAALPLDYDSTTSGGRNFGSGSGLYDSLITPAILSWSLPADFHVAAQLGVWVPDGSNNKSIYVRNSNRYWAIEPGVGLSWLHDGWNASVLFTYDVNFSKGADNQGGTTFRDYQSGDQFIAEYSLTKTIGKWTVGLGGYGLKQVEDDQATLANGTKANQPGSAAQKYAIGPIVGYNFGPVIAQAYYNQNIETKNYVGGDEFWTRLLVPF